jgi:hypothetical protein
MTARIEQLPATDWPNRFVAYGAGYLRRHPIASLTTVGEQFVLGVPADEPDPRCSPRHRSG